MISLINHLLTNAGESLMKQISMFLKVMLVTTLFVFGGATNAQWVWQNPKPTGVLIWDVFFVDANTGTAVGEIGTILKTTDGGANWEFQNGGTYENLNGVYFTDSNTGTVVGGDGTILRTTDGGANWIAQTSGVTNLLLDVFFTDANTGTAVGGGGTVVRTTDGGTNWVIQTTSFGSTVRGVSFTDANTGWIVGDSGGILKTTDGGSTWVVQTSGTTQDIWGVYFVNANTGTAVGANGLIINTTDGGANWVAQTSGTTEPFYKVSLTDANTGTTVGGAGTILKTTDGGTNWVSQSSGTTNYIRGLCFSDANNGTAVGDKGTIVRTTNGGTSWISQTTVVTSENIRGVSFTDANNGTAAGNDGTILRTTDGGATWVSQTSGTTAILNAVSCGDVNTGTAVGANGTIIHTTDGGTTWVNQTSGTAQILYGVHFIDANNGTAVGGGSTILRTTDGGASWISQTAPVSDYWVAVFFTDANTGTIVGYTHNILRTTDGGTTWVTQTSGTTSNLWNVCFTDANTGTVVGFGGTILRTTDGGTNWVPQTSGTSDKLYGVSFTDANNGVVVGDFGTILRTSDGGMNWISDVVTSNQLNGVSLGTAVGLGTILKYNNAATTFQLTVNVDNGWNMVSIPGMHPVDQNVDTWWPGKDPGANVFKYSGGYQSVTDATPTEGYWMKNAGAQTYNTGDEWPAGGITIVPNDPIAGNTGWNLIGGYHYNALTSGITTTPGGAQTGAVFGYTNTTGYTEATELLPGYAYWLKLTQVAQINLPDPTFRPAEKLAGNDEKEKFGKIIITDKAGRTYTLYAGAEKTVLDNYELPPVPFADMFDVRYSSGRYVEQLGASHKEIKMQGVEYPVSIRAEGFALKVMDESGKMINVNLKDGESASINNSSISKLIVTTETIPLEFALEQNYPNPFNPTTTIRFAIPEVTNVKLTIYNILGERVAELLNQQMEPGYYNYVWDAGNVASGLYVYEVRTDKNNAVKKMMLLK